VHCWPGWDRYAAAQWLNIRRWLDANPDDELAGQMRAELATAPSTIRQLPARISRRAAGCGPSCTTVTARISRTGAGERLGRLGGWLGRLGGRRTGSLEH
jgi:hypothetical protein